MLVPSPLVFEDIKVSSQIFVFKNNTLLAVQRVTGTVWSQHLIVPGNCGSSDVLQYYAPRQA